MQVFELVKNITRKNYLLVEFGLNGSHKWMNDPSLASIVSDYRVIMQDSNRYIYKLNGL